jgi:hypothetical protein
VLPILLLETVKQCSREDPHMTAKQRFKQQLEAAGRASVTVRVDPVVREALGVLSKQGDLSLSEYANRVLLSHAAESMPEFLVDAPEQLRRLGDVSEHIKRLADEANGPEYIRPKPKLDDPLPPSKRKPKLQE